MAIPSLTFNTLIRIAAILSSVEAFSSIPAQRSTTAISHSTTHLAKHGIDRPVVRRYWHIQNCDLVAKNTRDVPSSFGFSTASSSISLITLSARPRSKWDDLTDEDDDMNDDGIIDVYQQIQKEKNAKNSTKSKVPKDMEYTQVNIRRQADTYDQLVEIGGSSVVNDVYVRAPGGREWWLVGKVARVSDVTPEQAIERQWPLIERHVWALRIPVRPTSDLSAPFEVWYAPGDSEYDAALNDPNVKFTKVEGEKCVGGGEVKCALVGFVGKVYEVNEGHGAGEGLFFVERNNDGSVLGGKIEGDWVLKSEIERESQNLQFE